MIGILAVLGSLLAVTFYFDGGVSQKDIVQADQSEMIEDSHKSE